MAILGEAHIIVRAITDGVGDDIKRAFNDSGVNESVNKNSKALKSNADKALSASKAWTKLNRTSMVAQGAIGTLAGGVSALVSGGVIPLIAVLGQAATAGVAVVGVFAAIKVGTMVAKSAMKGISQAVNQASNSNMAYKKTLKQVREEMQQLAFDAEDAALGEKRAALNLEQAREELMRVQDLPPNNRARRDAELAYEEADLAFRRAKDRNNDMQDQINNPPKQKNAQDPFKHLTASQKDFAQYLISIKGNMKDLKEAAASGFLPLLKMQIDRVIKGPAWGTLLKGYNTVGVSLGKAAKNFVDALTKGNNLSNLTEFFRMTAAILPKLGSVLGSLFGAFLGVMKAAAPLTLKFVNYLVKATDHLDKLVAVKSNSGQLTGFFKKAGDMASQLGRIFKNWFGGLSAMFGAATGPGSGGQMLLDWLERASKRYKEARTSFSGKLLNEKNFQSATGNFIVMAQALGKIGNAFKGLNEGGGTSFFTEVAKAAPYIHEILVNAVRTGKSFGTLVASVIKLVSVFSDAGQASAFFDILATNINFIAGIFKAIPAPIMAFVGVVFGAISALTLLWNWGGKIALVFKGFAIQTVIAGARLRGLTAEQAVATTGFKTLGITAKVAGETMKASMASNLVLLALTTVLEVVMAIGNAVEENNQKMRDSATAAIEAGKTGAQAFDAMRAPDTGINKVTADIKNLGKSLTAIEEARKNGEAFGGNWLTDMVDSSDSVNRYHNALNHVVSLTDKYGQVLGDLAGTDIEKAQKAFASFTESHHLSNVQARIALLDMPKYRDALIKQADALGVNIRNTDGTVNSIKQLQFAMGNGEIATLRAAAAAKEFNDKIAGAAAEVINLGDAVEKNTNKVTGKTDVKGLIKTLGQQALDASAYYANLLKIRGRGVGQPVIDSIIGMGAKQGSAAAAALAKASDADLSTLAATYSQIGSLTGDEMSAKLAEAGPAIQDAFRNLGKAGMNAFIAQLLQGKSIKDAMTAVVKDLNNSQKKIVYSVDSAGNIHAKNKDTGKQLYAAGGLVTPRRFAVGSNNPLQGFGGPQADTIPAYLSAGEFVMNASATSRFLPTLRSMNQTSLANNRLNSTVPSAQAPRPASAPVNIVVNPAPGMNETELAQRVAVAMARQMRQGAF